MSVSADRLKRLPVLNVWDKYTVVLALKAQEHMLHGRWRAKQKVNDALRRKRQIIWGVLLLSLQRLFSLFPELMRGCTTLYTLCPSLILYF